MVVCECIQHSASYHPLHTGTNASTYALDNLVLELHCISEYYIAYWVFRKPNQQFWSFYRAMHFSAKRGIVIACRLSVRDVGGSGPHRSEILETNCTDN